MSLLDEVGQAMQPSEADWDHHKETIRRLYCIEKKRLNGVQEEMRDRYKFDADAYQYEKHFKRWNFRKNIKTEEWTPIRQKILARKREGKDSDVYLEGVLVPAKKVKREIGRCRRADDELNLLIHQYASTPQTPDGISIATPTPMEDSSNVFGNLPIAHYFAALLHQASPQGHNTIYPATTFNWSSHITVPTMSTLKVIKSSRQILGSSDCTAPATGSWIPDLGIETEDTFPLQGLELAHILPEHSGALRTLQFMIFFISNNYLDSAHYSLHKSIIEWLQQKDNGPLLRRLLSVGGSTAETTLKTLYPYAVEGQEASIVKIFIDLGCDPNIVFNNNNRGDLRGTTALGLACEENNLELASVLLAAGADPNQLSKPCFTQDEGSSDGPLEDQCPLVLFIWGNECHYSSITTLEEDADVSALLFVKSLIHAGALVHGPSPVRRLPLVEAVQCGYTSVIRLLLEEGADVNLCDGLGMLPLAIAIECQKFDSPAKSNQSLSIIRLLLGAGADVNTPSNRLRGPGVNLPYDSAAATGSLELVKILYSANARPGRFGLTCAIMGKNLDVVKFTLEVGTIKSNVLEHQSALVEAIRSGKAEMFRLVFESAAEQQDSNTLSIAVEAAINRKMYDIVPQLLAAGLRYPSFTMELQLAVSSAVCSGNVELFELLLSAGAEAGSDVLVQAFRSNHEPMIMKVLNMGTTRPFDVTENNEDEDDEDDEDDDSNRKKCIWCGKRPYDTIDSPLMAAAHFGDCDIVKRLLEQGASLTDPNVLVCAIRCKSLEMVATLLEAGSPINAIVCDGGSDLTPLQAAITTRQLSLIQLLLDNGANPDLSLHSHNHSTNGKFGGSEPPLQLAVSLGDREIAMMLLRAGADINNPYAKYWACSALALAIRSKNQQMLELVLDHGAQTLDSTALLEAVQQGDIPLVKGLLTLSSRVGQKHGGTFGYEALCRAIVQKSMNMVKLLLSAGMNPNKRLDKMTALGVAITHYNGPAMEIVEMLLQAGADPNGYMERPSYDGGAMTALVAAARTGEVPLVSLLIQHGADPHEHPKGVIRRSPLQAACEKGKFRVVQLLMEHGVDVNTPPAWCNGGTALQLAAINGHLGIILALLDRGAELNAPAARINGRTALEGAAENGRLDAVRALLDAGVGIHGPCEGQYNRALEFAGKNGHLHIQRELVSRAEASI